MSQKKDASFNRPQKIEGDIISRLFRHSPEPIFIVDERGAIIDASFSACDVFGLTYEEMLKTEFDRLLSANDRSRLPELLKEENLTGSLKSRISFTTKNGDTITAFMATSLTEIEGTVYRWASLHVDTDESDHPAKDEGTLHSADISAFLPVISSEPEMVIEIDPAGTIIRANTLSIEKSLYSKSELNSDSNIMSFFQEEDRKHVRSDIETVLLGQKLDGVEYSFVKKDGSLLPIIASLSPLTKDGVITGVRAVALDITEHKNTEHNLMIMEKLRVLGELAGGVVHDFNNILSIILGYTQTIPNECADDRCLNKLKKIRNAALDGTEIIKRIQNFTQINVQQEMEQVDLNTVVEEVVALLEPNWQPGNEKHGKDITFVTHLVEVPPTLASPSELREVVSNFVLNAIDAIEERGTVMLSTDAGKDYTSVNIADDGGGMPENVKSRVFEPFFTTKKDHGTGLGMCVSYGIIKKLGGDIVIESDVGVGTTVSILLPHISQETVDNGSLQPESNESLCHRILVVDDEENICEILNEYLKEEGHVVVTAKSAEDGLDLFRSGDFTIVVTDLNMPGMSGWDMARIIKEESPGTIILMLSGWGTEIEERNKSENIVDRFMPKPINFTHLSSFVNSIDVSK